MPDDVFLAADFSERDDAIGHQFRMENRRSEMTHCRSGLPKITALLLP